MNGDGAYDQIYDQWGYWWGYWGFQMEGDYWVATLPFWAADQITSDAVLKLNDLTFAIDLAVGDVPPAIRIQSSVQLNVGVAYGFTFSVHDPGYDFVGSLVVQWGDGQSQTIPGGPGGFTHGTYSHTYTAPGFYTVWVTATNEEGSWSATREIVVGDMNAVPPVSDDPVIVATAGTPQPDGTATLTVLDENGQPFAIYEWDLDGDGHYETSWGPTVTLAADPGAYYPYTAGVRVTDAAGRTSEALLGFVNAGPVQPKATINNYRKLFREATPDAPLNWQIHHTIQVGRVAGFNYGIIAYRYWRERGINVHEAQYLRAVHPKVHSEITKAQTAWWREQAKRFGSADEAMRRIPLAEYDAFVAKLDAQYNQWWIGPGRDQTSKLATIANRFNQSGGRWSFVAGKATRWKNLGFTALNGIALFGLFTENAKAAANIALHDQNQLNKWDAFAAAYDGAIDEVLRTNRLSHNTALHLRDAMLAYGRSIELDADALNAIEAALGAHIDIHLPH